jgi:hypothetical protein
MQAQRACNETAAQAAVFLLFELNDRSSDKDHKWQRKN